MTTLEKKYNKYIIKFIRDWLITGSEDTFVNVWSIKDNIELVVSYHLTDSLVFGLTEISESIYIASYESNELTHL